MNMTSVSFSKLGVVGSGIVGNAFYEGMKHAFDVVRFDKYNFEASDTTNVESLLWAVDGPVFVCVPTPMNADGSANTSIVEGVVSSILEWDKKRIIVVKSTVPPGTCERLSRLHRATVVFNPEFLTEANPVQDFKNQDRIVIGATDAATEIISFIYQKAYPDVIQVHCDSTTAEMVKYVANCFLATKVAFANEMYQICNKLGVRYDEVVHAATLDDRLGESHWKVPGPMLADDGSKRKLFGFGGSCFVKDINALIKVAESLQVDPKVLRGAWEKNLEVRPERDWEHLKGRAVS
jgi:nucleotide sugar dehydrogenase